MRFKSTGIFALVIVLVFAILAGCAGGKSSNTESTSGKTTEEKPFYNSNDVIELVVPFGEGGGTDAAARLFQKHLPKHIEGNPKVQVINVPGSGGINGVNKYEMGRSDGYSLLQSSTSLIMHYILGTEAMKFDYKTQVPLISIPGPGVTVLSNKIYNGDPKELLKLKKDELIYGSTAPNGASAKTVLMLEFLKLADNTQYIWGYDGTGSAWLAFQMDEINVHSAPASEYLSSIKEEGIVQPLSQIGSVDENGEMQRYPEISDVPTIIEVYKEMYGEEPSGPLYDAIKALSYVDDMSKTLYMPKDAPKEAIAALEDAMSKLAQDEEFINDVLEVLESKNIIVGDKLDNLSENFDNINEESLKYIRKLLNEKYGVEGLQY
jgi:tripartite-type tricarboxylate transporter receptor subunit TctC